MTRLNETSVRPVQQCGKPQVLRTDAVEILICSACLGQMKQGLASTECDCGKVFHVSCARRMGNCTSCGSKIEDRMMVAGVKQEEEPEVDFESFPIPKLRLTSEEKLELLEERLLLGEISERTFRELKDKLVSELEAVRFQCPCCSRFIGQEDETCECGAVFSDEEIGNAMVCPECSSVIPNDSVVCQSCGVRFIEDGILVCPVCLRELDLDAGRCECGARFSDEAVLGFLCPRCEEFQEQDNNSCTVCGVQFVEEDDILYQCASCGETFREDLDRCPTCRADFS